MKSESLQNLLFVFTAVILLLQYIKTCYEPKFIFLSAKNLIMLGVLFLGIIVVLINFLIQDKRNRDIKANMVKQEALQEQNKKLIDQNATLLEQNSILTRKLNEWTAPRIMMLKDIDERMNDTIGLVLAGPDESDNEYMRLIKQALVLYKKNHTDKRVLEIFDQAINLRPDTWVAYYNRAYVNYQNKEYDKVLIDTAEAIKYKGIYAGVYSLRGDAYFRLRNFDNAVNEYKLAIDLDPNNAVLFLRRGKSYLLKGDYENAYKDLNKSTEQNPKLEESYSGRGIILYQTKAYSSAIQEYNQAIKINPSNPILFYGRSLSYFALCKDELGRKDMEKAAELGMQEAQNILKETDLKAAISKIIAGSH